MFQLESHNGSNEVDGKHQEMEHGKFSFEFVKDVSAHTQADSSSSFDKEFVFPDLDTATTFEAGIHNVGMLALKGEAVGSSTKPMAALACIPKPEKLILAKISSTKPMSRAPIIQSRKVTKPNSRFPNRTSAKISMAVDVAQENQAIKRQKLDGDRARKILDPRSRVLPHKSKLGLIGGPNFSTFADKNDQEAAPFMSTADMVKKFKSGTREIEPLQNGSLSRVDKTSLIQRRPKLTLTRPKEPELETMRRVRAVRAKSSAELEEEMLAKIPKFKARPFNKKILEAPSLPVPAKTSPQITVFQEFNLKTMARATQHSERQPAFSFKASSSQGQIKPLLLTESRPPHLETALRARAPRIKSSQELELEHLENIPKFKARPLNKKIFESNGDLGLFYNPKPQLTTPQEFRFATSERLGPPTTVTELFDKISLHPEPHEKVPRITTQNPFHLHTEGRGLEKEKQFAEQISQKQMEEERARILKANPYPYTTDYPVMPPKPEPKPRTTPESFQLESLVRHEEEMQRKLEEKQEMEKKEIQRRNFKAQPIMRDDPLPLPKKERKPLTEIQEFVLRVDHRAVHRSQFDQKIKEKEKASKRSREENEKAKMIEEERAVKKMRRTMVPQARPLPKFNNPFYPQKSTKETTKPIAPDLNVARREERRHLSQM